MTETTDVTLEAMEIYGGSFVQALARCYRLADEPNRLRLQLAFPHVFTEYETLATRRKGQHHG